MYCKNCGKKVVEENQYCLECGYQKDKGDKFCLHCCAEVNGAELCLTCGKINERLPKIQTVICQKCKRAMPLESAFCNNCGNNIADEKNACPKCHKKIKAEADVCLSCGNVLRANIHRPVMANQQRAYVNSPMMAQDRPIKVKKQKVDKSVPVETNKLFFPAKILAVIATILMVVFTAIKITTVIFAMIIIANGYNSYSEFMVGNNGNYVFEYLHLINDSLLARLLFMGAFITLIVSVVLLSLSKNHKYKIITLLRNIIIPVLGGALLVFVIVGTFTVTPAIYAFLYILFYIFAVALIANLVLHFIFGPKAKKNIVKFVLEAALAVFIVVSVSLFIVIATMYYDFSFLSGVEILIYGPNVDQMVSASFGNGVFFIDYTVTLVFYIITSVAALASVVAVFFQKKVVPQPAVIEESKI